MSSDTIARRLNYEVAFDGEDMTTSISPYFKSLTYTDVEEDEADDIQIQLHDRDGLWRESWLQEAIEKAADNKKVEAVTKTVTKQADPYTHKVNCNIGLNIRSGPGMGYGVVGVFAYNRKIRAAGGTSGSWTKVIYTASGKTGWCWTSYLTPISGKEAEGETWEEEVTEETVTDNGGLKITAIILRQNWESDGKDNYLNCGQFELDSVDFSGPPGVVVLKGTALPFSAAIRQTKKSKGWESYTLSRIIKEIADKNGMAVLYSSAQDPYYERVEQSRVSDITFIQKLCHDAGISLKVSNNIVVAFDQAEYEAKGSIRKITYGDGSYEKFKLNTGQNDTQYSSCRVSYTPPNGDVIEATAYIEDYDAESDSNQQLEVTAKVENTSEALLLAHKHLRLHNKYGLTASFTMPGDPTLVAGVTVELGGWGPWSGKSIVKKAAHRVTESGYTTTIDVRKVLEGI